MPAIRKLPEDNVREGFYTGGEVEKIIATMPQDLQDFTRWGFLTGWRKGEIISLRWADVDRDAGSLRLSWRKSKNKKARTMALVGDLADIIERRWAARTVMTKEKATLLSPLVFHRSEGHGKHRGEVRPVGDFDKALKAACAAAGLPYGRKVDGGRTFHCFRRTAARNLRNADVPENVCMAITGHKTRSIFDRYSIVNEKDTAEAMTKRLAPRPPPAGREQRCAAQEGGRGAGVGGPNDRVASSFDTVCAQKHQGADRLPRPTPWFSATYLVAGAGFEPATFGL